MPKYGLQPDGLTGPDNRKISLKEARAILAAAGFYTADGQFTSNRSVDGNGKSLSFSGLLSLLISTTGDITLNPGATNSLLLGSSADPVTQITSPQTGLLKYGTDDNKYFGYNGSRYITVGEERDNYVLVKSKADFPAPVSGVITLADNTVYEINGAVALGTDRIELGANNIIIGGDPFTDSITYTGVGAMFTMLNADFVLSNMSFINSSGYAIDATGSGTEKFKIEGCVFSGGTSIGTVNGGFDQHIITGNLFVGMAEGIHYTASAGNIQFISNFFVALTGTATLIRIDNNSTYHTFIISGNMLETTASQTGLHISPVITITGGGIIAGNSFEGSGTLLSGIDPSHPDWLIAPQGNVGIPGLLNIKPDVIVDSTYSTTSATMAQVPLNVPLFKYIDYQDNATNLVGKYDAEVTHDQSGQTVAIDCYNVTDGVAMGFGSNAKLDVDTIAWQSGNTVRYTFNGSPDLSNVKIGDFMTVESAANASNNGQFVITAFDDTADWIEIENGGRTDATDDEASDSTATAYGGSVVYHTITTGGTYEAIETPRFHMDESKEYRARMRRVSLSGGNPAVFIRNGAGYGVLTVVNY